MLRRFIFQFWTFIGLFVRIPIQWNLLCAFVSAIQCSCKEKKKEENTVFLKLWSTFEFCVECAIYFIAQKIPCAHNNRIRTVSAVCVSVYYANRCTRLHRISRKNDLLSKPWMFMLNFSIRTKWRTFNLVRKSSRKLILTKTLKYKELESQSKIMWI